MTLDVHNAIPLTTDVLSDPCARLGLLVCSSDPDGAEDTGLAHDSGGSTSANPSSSETRVAADQRPSSAGPRRQQPASTARCTTKTKKTLGSVLRARRHALQLTQREVAAKLGVKPAHIAYLELDHRRPSLSLLGRIADVLDLDRERLILLSHPEARSFISGARKPEAVLPRDQAWRDFKRNKSVLSRYKVSKKELQVLSQVALLGRVTTPRSFLFILNSMRQAVEDEEA
jgi:transcriptional regulator with XRE-family HTH domain